jgi:hypothetical protein
MNWSRMLALIVAPSLMSLVNADVNLREGCAVRFASVEEGAEILGRKDEFIQRLSAFDRAARMKTDRSYPRRGSARGADFVFKSGEI